MTPDSHFRIVISPSVNRSNHLERPVSVSFWIVLEQGGMSAAAHNTQYYGRENALECAWEAMKLANAIATTLRLTTPNAAIDIVMPEGCADTYCLADVLREAR